VTTITIPDTSEGLEEMLHDPAKVKAVFGNPESLREFLNKHADVRNAKDAEIAAQQREQMQLVLAEYLKDSGLSRSGQAVAAGTGQAALTALTNGGSHAPGSVARKQSFYNRSAAGAPLDGTFDSIGDFMRACAQEGAGRTYRDSAALGTKLDKVREIQNAFGTDVPSDGGFLVPEQFRSDLLMLALESGVVRPRATVIPMGSQTLALPAVDVTSNATTVFGGIQTYWVDESTAPTETSAKFMQVKLDAKKLMAYCTVPSELPADAPAFAAFIDQALPQAMAFEEDYRFIAGTGAGEPLGFVSCAAAITANAVSGQGASTIVVDNLAAMYARMLPSSLSRAIWIADIGTFPQLALMAVQGSLGNSTPVWMNNGVIDAPPLTIYGRPVYFTEKVPALGTTGDINFVDPSFYLIGDRQAITASASPHFAFSTDKIAYKIIERVDGRPWLQSAITPKNSGNTLSAFVQLSSTRT
jgi:HK97 family phage major capsid protein